MKSNFKYGLLALAAFALVWAEGCQTKLAPVGVYSAPATTPNYSLIANFDGNLNTPPDPSNQTNTYLYEIGGPGNVIVAPGPWNVVNNFTGINKNGVPYETGNIAITGGGPGGLSDNACHIWGVVNDTGDGTYPAIELSATLDTTPPVTPVPAGQKSGYNMSFFSGVKFEINILSDDTATARYFYVPTTQEAAPPAGTCTATTGCYNYFGYTFTSATNGWVPISKNFTDLKTSYGIQPNPASLTGINLQEVTGLLWSEGNANGGKSVVVDFWVDDVYFY